MNQSTFAILAVFVAAQIQAQIPSPAPDSKGGYASGIQITPLLRATTTANGQPIEYPKTDKPVVNVVIVEIPPGGQTGWHIHRKPLFEYVLSGTLTVELENGKAFTYETGRAFAEVINTPHNGKNNGTVPVKLLMTVIGEQGIPIADKLTK